MALSDQRQLLTHNLMQETVLKKYRRGLGPADARTAAEIGLKARMLLDVIPDTVCPPLVLDA